jgi:error-prone DNA polymerase
MWAAGALAEIDPGRLAMAPGVEAPTLAGMEEQEAHRADLWATGISTRHPLEFVREELVAQGCMTAEDVLGLHRMSASVRVAGVVTHRQRPSTSQGVIFFNLEDETGQLNVIVLPDIWDRYRLVARKSPALIIDGRVEYRDGVTNLVARAMEPVGVYTLPSRDFR